MKKLLIVLGGVALTASMLIAMDGAIMKKGKNIEAVKAKRIANIDKKIAIFNEQKVCVQAVTKYREFQKCAKQATKKMKALHKENKQKAKAHKKKMREKRQNKNPNPANTTMGAGN